MIPTQEKSKEVISKLEKVECLAVNIGYPLEKIEYQSEKKIKENAIDSNGVLAFAYQVFPNFLCLDSKTYRKSMESLGMQEGRSSSSEISCKSCSVTDIAITFSSHYIKKNYKKVFNAFCAFSKKHSVSNSRKRVAKCFSTQIILNPVFKKWANFALTKSVLNNKVQWMRKKNYARTIDQIFSKLQANIKISKSLKAKNSTAQYVYGNKSIQKSFQSLKDYTDIRVNFLTKR